MLTFSVSTHSKNLNYDEECHEDGNPNTDIDIGTPKPNCEACSGYFEW